jgi:enediyne biosynthesis protein CalE5
MTVQPDDQLRDRVHAMWAAVADQWGAYADDVDERGKDVTARMLAAALPRPGDRVLELACGPGGAGIAAADLVGPQGNVVLSDVVAEMTVIAATRATARGLTNVSTAQIDLEAIDAEDSTYDVVLCREGLMFAVDPARAAGEMQRVLRPGGRLAVAVWGTQQDNPWLGLVFEAVTATTGFPVPPPGVPGPFSLGDEAHLQTLLAAAGFAEITIERLPTPLRSLSFDAWWARTRAVAGPLSAIVARLDSSTRAALEERLRAAVQPYTSETGVELPGVALVASARRAT